jgi:hypothetical protein
VGAGRGLAAAHGAGLVHRDFKPENVLVGADGRARVGDFGLARVVGEGRGEGGLVGTPYYMSPEQLRGEPADARSDQYSFCVALRRALQGDTPPGWLRRTLARGLAASPAERYPSMAALLADLERGLSRRPARWIGAGVVAIVVGVASYVAAQREDPAALCQVGAEAWRGVWDPARRAEIERRFLASGRPYAADAFAQVARRLDDQVAAWSAMSRAACEDTRVRRVQPEAVLERRQACLDARRRELAALTARFAHADEQILENAAPALGRLGELSSCADLVALASTVPPPASVAARARIAALEPRLAELKAARLAGGDGRKPDAARALVEEARAAGYRPIEAQALLELGWLEEQGGDYPAAARSYEQGVWAAEAGGDDELAARLWGMRMMNAGQSLRRIDEALTMRPRITALLERLGQRPELEARLHLSTAWLLLGAEKPADGYV